MYSEEDYIQISALQHFRFCRRQWALMYIEGLWRENELTVEGDLIHKRAHDKSLSESRGDELIVRGLPVKSSVMGVSGECDAVVFRKTDDGVALRGREGLWSVMPVEYKRGHTKTNDCDRLQVAAQALCLEEMFCCRIDMGALYYHETRSREYVDIDDELRDTVIKAFAEMHDLIKKSYTPKAKRSSRCFKCSLCDLCLPTLSDGGSAVEYIRAHITETS